MDIWREHAQRFDDTAAFVALCDRVAGMAFDRRRAAARSRAHVIGIALQREHDGMLPQLHAGADWMDRNDGHKGATAHDQREQAWLTLLERYEAVAGALRAAEGTTAFLTSGNPTASTRSGD
jgi:hypothetical protein